MTSGRRSRGQRTAEASRALPPRRGEQFCREDAHSVTDVAEGGVCPECGAVK